MLGEEFHSVVLRMAVHIERIAMILSALRGVSSLTAQRDSAEAQSQGIPQSTVMRWYSQWIDRGTLCRLSYGHYKKIA